jgi:hypothetical protein
MKYFWLFTILWYSTFVTAQESERKPISLEAHYFTGNIMEHNPSIAHLITSHPEGFFLQYNRKTYGFNAWEQRYNYPDWGFTMIFQNMHNPHLGRLYSLYGHHSWYFFKRHLRLSVGQGIAFASKPYHPDLNYQNNVYGSHFLSTTYLQGGFVKENIWQGLGVFAGFSIIHYSNGNIKAPNTSTNTLGFTLGAHYLLDHENFPDYIYTEEQEKHTEPVRFNAVLRGGVNESDVVQLGSKPFYIFGVSADKVLSRKSKIEAGVEVFFSTFLKDYIEYRAIAYPEDNSSGDEDWKRAGVFLGYEMRFDKNAAFVNLGYYFYYPYDFEGQLYNRLGLKRYFGSQEKIYGLVNVRAHAAKAEALEFGIGYRL